MIPRVLASLCLVLLCSSLMGCDTYYRHHHHRRLYEQQRYNLYPYRY
jgi:hypothetical protein